MLNRGKSFDVTSEFTLKQVLVSKERSLYSTDLDTPHRVWEVPPGLVKPSEFKARFAQIEPSKYILYKLFLRNSPYGSTDTVFYETCTIGMECIIVQSEEELKIAMEDLKTKLETTTISYLNQPDLLKMVLDAQKQWDKLPLPEWYSG